MDKKKNNLYGTDEKEKTPAADPVNYMNHMAETENHVVSAAGIRAINVVTRGERMRQYRRRPGSFFMLFLVTAAAVITVAALLLLVGYILINGIPHLKLSMFAWEYTTENVSMMPAIINTFTMVGMSLIIAVPLGLFSAIYLVEYAGRGNKLVKVHPSGCGNFGRNSLDRLRSFRKSDVRRIPAHGIFDARRCADAGDHGSSVRFCGPARKL